MTDFSNIDRWPAKKKRKTFLKKEQNSMADIGSLFDICCEDTKQCNEIEESHKLKMTEKDFDFYLDQKTEESINASTQLRLFNRVT